MHRVTRLLGHLAPRSSSSLSIVGMAGAPTCTIPSRLLSASATAAASNSSCSTSGRGTFAGQVALVTGASNGIGKATARAFAAHGANVVLADVCAKEGTALATEINTLGGGRALFVPCDVSSEADVSALFKKTIEQFGRLDCAFNNAGIEGESNGFDPNSTANWDRVININLKGVFLCMKYELPIMVKQGGGTIVNNSSIAGLVGFHGIPAYVASKHGIIGLTQTAALDYATQKVRINAVCPGVIKTPMIDRFTHGDPETLKAFTAMEPVGRLGEPEEIADAVLFLSGKRSSFITGQALAVDGGYVAQ